MTVHPEPALLDTFPNPYIAETVASILRDEGVNAFVVGAELQDEFAASQRVLGNVSVQVFVPSDQVEEAKSILAAARAAGHVADGEEPAADDA